MFPGFAPGFLLGGGDDESPLSLSPGPSGDGPGPRSSQQEQKNLVERLVAFMMKVINDDLDSFWQSCYPHFDQDPNELISAGRGGKGGTGQGETLQQYALYQDYLKILDEKLEYFARSEGFSPDQGAEILVALQTLITQDKDKAEKEFAGFFNSMVGMLKASALMTGVSVEEIENNFPKEGTPEFEEMKEDMRRTFAPRTADDMVQMILGMTEYEWFSGLMRAKCQQEKLIAEVKAKREEGQLRMDADRNDKLGGLGFRFVEFGMTMLERDLEPFYRKVQPLFEVDTNEGPGGPGDPRTSANGSTGSTEDGRRPSEKVQHYTHAQWGAFQEYLRQIEGRLQEFAAKEELNAVELFTRLDGIMAEDRRKADEALAKILAEVEGKKQEMIAEMAKRREKRRHELLKSGKVPLEQIDDALDKELGPREPKIVIERPRTLSDLIEHFLSETEYAGFAKMMRERIEEEKFLTLLFGADAVRGIRGGDPDGGNAIEGSDPRESLPLGQLPNSMGVSVSEHGVLSQDPQYQGGPGSGQFGDLNPQQPEMSYSNNSYGGPGGPNYSQPINQSINSTNSDLLNQALSQAAGTANQEFHFDQNAMDIVDIELDDQFGSGGLHEAGILPQPQTNYGQIMGQPQQQPQYGHGVDPYLNTQNPGDNENSPTHDPNGHPQHFDPFLNHEQPQLRYAQEAHGGAPDPNQQMAQQYQDPLLYGGTQSQAEEGFQQWQQQQFQ